MLRCNVVVVNTTSDLSDSKETSLGFLAGLPHPTNSGVGNEHANHFLAASRLGLGQCCAVARIPAGSPIFCIDDYMGVGEQDADDGSVAIISRQVQRRRHQL